AEALGHRLRMNRGATAMNEQAKIAVVGAGWWATYTHIPALQAHTGVGEIVLCDSSADKLGAAAEAYHIAKTYTDLQTMLAQEPLDGAVIATSHADHFALPNACLERARQVV